MFIRKKKLIKLIEKAVDERTDIYGKGIHILLDKMKNIEEPLVEVLSMSVRRLTIVNNMKQFEGDLKEMLKKINDSKSSIIRLK